MSTVLIIEDNENIRKEVSSYFELNGFFTICPVDIKNVDQLAEKADAVLLDINLQEGDGFSICKKIRETSQIPILFVTGRDSEKDELCAIALGGDDYLRKPYSLPVLLAKVKRMLERNTTNCTEELVLGDAVLNIVKGQLKLKNEVLELSKNEMKLLSCLFLNKDRTVPKDEFIEYLWENKLYVDENIFNVNLSRLRKRLSDIGHPDFIETVPRLGYRIRRGNYL
ncbi:MAG: DNA-binding response regulator [Herbinix sp.]|jgi:DNA-binding response OmpR family regulator|nr:DNA-binding response regulator [Herbinix sp.]